MEDIFYKKESSSELNAEIVYLFFLWSLLKHSLLDRILKKMKLNILTLSDIASAILIT